MIRKPDSTKKRSTPRYPALGPAELQVVRHDADDRHAAQAVEGGEMPAGDGRRGRRRLGRSCTRVASVTPAPGGTRPACASGRSRRSPAATRKAGSSSPAVRSKAMRGLAPRRAGPVGGSLHREVRAVADHLPRLPEGPAEGAASASSSVKGGAKQSTLRPPHSEVEARQITGQHGRMAPPPGPSSIRAPSSTSGTTGARPAARTIGSPRARCAGTRRLHPSAAAWAACWRRPATSAAWRNRPSTARQVRAPGAAQRSQPAQARSHQPPASRARPARASRSRPPHNSARSSPVSRTSSSSGAGSALRAS